MALLKKRERQYYSGKAIREKGAFWNLILGGKNIGKSYDFKTWLLDTCTKEQKTFCLVFRYEHAWKTNGKVEDYFKDMGINQKILELTGGEYTCIRCKDRKIYLGNERGCEKEKKQFGVCIGYWAFINQQQSINSQVFENCFFILFEEFISNSGYLFDEVHKFELMVNTILRERAYSGQAQVFLLGNTINRVNPYLTQWNLMDVLKMKQGEIKTFKRTTEFSDGREFTVEIAVEMCEDFEIGGIALGKRAQQEEKGQWEIENVPVLKKSWKEFTELGRFVFVWEGFYFLCRALTDDFTNVFLYVERLTKPLTNGTRIIGTINEDEEPFLMSVYYTKGFTPLVDAERKMFQLIPQGKILFCDKQTGTDFWACYESM